MVQEAGSTGFGEEFGTEANQASSRYQVVHANPSGSVVDHLIHAALAQCHELGDNAKVVLGDVN